MARWSSPPDPFIAPEPSGSPIHLLEWGCQASTGCEKPCTSSGAARRLLSSVSDATPILAQLFAKKIGIFLHVGTQKCCLLYHPDILALILASLRHSVTDLRNDTSLSHHSPLTSAECRDRVRRSGVTFQTFIAKKRQKGGPFGAGADAAKC